MFNKYSITTIVAVIAALVIGYIFYDKFSVKTVSYTGLGDVSQIEAQEVKPDVLASQEKEDATTVEFAQRKITGGGVNPGWVISLLETQPNIFTGRVIVDDGVYQHPVTVKEEVTNVFIGEMKSKDNKKEIFSMKKFNQNCTDTEGNVFEYSLSGTYGATQFSGCGGSLLKASE